MFARREYPSVCVMDDKVTTLALCEVEVKRKLLEAIRTIQMKINRLRASEVAQRQEFEKNCKPLIEPLKNLTIRNPNIMMMLMMLLKHRKKKMRLRLPKTSLRMRVNWRNLVNLRDFPNEFDNTYVPQYEHGF